MTLDKAIKGVTALLEEEHYYPTGKYQGALKLLIEAGEAVIKSRREHHSFVPSLLPGETEE